MPAIVQEPEMITATREQPTPASIQEQSATSDELKDVPKKMTAIAPSDQSKSTLFVSALPFDATTADLMAFFAEVGPIRSAFVIKKKSPAVVSEESTPLEPDLTETTAVNPGLETAMNNGCGYVQFALPEDAARAIKDLKKVKFQGKRTLRIQFALKKSVAVERKKSMAPF